MKKNLILWFLAACFMQGYAQTPAIIEAAGWLESAFVRWEPVPEAQSYNVYVSGNGISEKKLDTQLIRSYGTYLRADALGLAAGNYTLKITAVVAGAESGETVTSTLEVQPQDRSGFAFVGGRVPGAYKIDGTLKENAVILYITENNKDTVSMHVTGANANPCIGLQAILDGFKKGNDTRPLVVRMIGQITDFNYMLGGDIVIENKNNAASFITLEGVGNDAVADGWGIRVKNATNIEVRNIGFMNCHSSEGDNVGLQQNNTHVWVHHCDMFYGDAGSDADQIKGDGALDCKGSTYVTFAYNHFWDSGKSNLLGLNEGTTTGLYITYHHNWYDHSDSRHPRVRFYSAHVYNNYYDGISKYGVGSTSGSSVFVEGNYFRNCKRPMMISMQGTDVWNAAKQANDYSSVPTFSKENGGIIKAFNNTFDYSGAQPRFVAYGDPNPAYNIAGKINSTVDFDAYVATERDEQVPANVQSVYGSNIYNNFDTDASLYVKTHIVDAPDVAKDKVIRYAGRVQGGDFQWTFNNATDDASSNVIPDLKTALKTYKTKLISVQGETSTPSSTQTLTSSGNHNQTVVQGESITNIVFTWSGDATDATVVGLSASGMNVMKNAADQTLTILGTPTETVSYTVTTSGASGMPVSISGTITVADSGGNVDDGMMIHNFTTDGKNSAFYEITGNLSTNYGTVVYDGNTLTQCLKMESSTHISFTTTQDATLTLVFAEVGKKVKIDGVSYTSDASGILSVALTPGTHTITKGDVMNLFFMKITTDIGSNIHSPTTLAVSVYPNPVSDNLNIHANAELKQVEIFSISGQLLKQIHGNTPQIDMHSFPNGNYVLRISTQENGSARPIFVKIIKK